MAERVHKGALIGAVTIGISTLPTWISFGPDAYGNAFSWRIGFLIFWADTLWQRGFALGWLIIGIAVTATVLSIGANGSMTRRACGGVVILIVATFVWQIARFLSALEQNGSNVFDLVGVGVYLAIGGGVLLIIDPWRATTKSTREVQVLDC